MTKSNSNSKRRSRNRGGRNNRSHTFDSNGPEVRIRGTAKQVYEKYFNLAKDAQGTDDLIMAENYFQHAEHYLRIMNEYNAEQEYRDKQAISRNRRSLSENSDDIVDNDSIGNVIGDGKGSSETMASA